MGCKQGVRSHTVHNFFSSVYNWPLCGFCFERINYSSCLHISFQHQLAPLCYKDKNLPEQPGQMAEAGQHISEECHTSVLSNLGLFANLLIVAFLIIVLLLRIFLLYKNSILNYFFSASLWRKTGKHYPDANWKLDNPKNTNYVI